jgi:ABC-2 type transport system permease protein
VVAELLRLRVRLLVNAFRRPAGVVFAIVLGIIAAFIALGVAWLGGLALHTQDDVYVGRMLVTVGTLLSLSAFLVPLAFTRSLSLHPQAFRIHGVRSGSIVMILLLFTLVGPLSLLAVLAYIPVIAWPDEASRELALVLAPLIFLIAVLSVRLGELVGVSLRRHPHTSTLVRVISIVLLVAGAASVVVIAAQRVPGMLWLVKLTGPVGFFRRLPEYLEATPIGQLWAAPGLASTTGGSPQQAWSAVWFAAAIALGLLIIWTAIVMRQLRPTRRLAVTRRSVSTGWFGRLPSSPTGAVAARSFSYWLRDPRYRTVFALIPLLPVVILGAFAVGGIPFQYAVLVPLPIMITVLSWSTIHNDVAYDSTAVWSHLAARTRGVEDRVGRIVPVLVFGVLLIGIGVPLTAWGYGSADIAPALLGVCLALLLGGIGVSSLVSARFPYPAPRPGDGAFQQPQMTGTQGGWTQALSLLLVIAIATPALVSSGFWFTAGGDWNWIALLMGAVAGVLVLVLGVRAGGRAFDNRGPELLAFAVRH